MHSSVVILIASAVAASAQLSLENNTYTCGKPNVAYCAGDSMKTDIIVRCDNKGHGTPGRCGDNLSGQPPIGNRFAMCVQTDEIVGDAACEKDCILYAESGTTTLPADVCKPTGTGSSSGTPTGSTSDTVITSSETTSATGTITSSDIVSNPPVTTTDTVPIGTISSKLPTTNGTIVTITSTTHGNSPTATPIPPSSTPPAGSAASHRTGTGLAALALLVAAYLV